VGDRAGRPVFRSGFGFSDRRCRLRPLHLRGRISASSATNLKPAAVAMAKQTLDGQTTGLPTWSIDLLARLSGTRRSRF